MAGEDGTGAGAFVRDYYGALRRGEPLAPYFADDPDTTKFGISESLFGGAAVAEGLREQTRTTREWRVESHRLRVDREGDHAWFSDVVDLAWTAEAGRRSFQTRWSGSLRRRDGAWKFVGMHVSVAHDLATGAATATDVPGATGGDR